jgi:hypothetical protein
MNETTEVTFRQAYYRPSDYDGYRAHSKARSTGTLVVLLDGIAQGLCEADDNRWWLICEDHGTCCSWGRQQSARHFMPAPEEWCEQCQTNYHGGN